MHAQLYPRSPYTYFYIASLTHSPLYINKYRTPCPAPRDGKRQHPLQHNSLNSPLLSSTPLAQATGDLLVQADAIAHSPGHCSLLAGSSTAGSPALASDARLRPGKLWLRREGMDGSQRLRPWCGRDSEDRECWGSEEIWRGVEAEGLGSCFKPTRKTGVLGRLEVGKTRGTTESREQK